MTEQQAYEAWECETYAEWQRTCHAYYDTGGADPWRFQCDQPVEHDGAHRCTDPMGPDTGSVEWDHRRLRVLN